MSPLERPTPQPDELSAPFWNTAKEGVLVMQRCAHCANLALPPVLFCEHCHSLESSFSFVPVSGRGHLVSWTIVHRALVRGFEDHVPFVYALVELDEQPRLYMAAELLDHNGEDLEAGSVVEVVFDDGQGARLPCFRLSPER